MAGQSNKAGYILLNRMIEEEITYNTFLEGDDHYLESILNDLAVQDWVQITGSTYQVTRKGREEYEAWIKKYYERIPHLEVFSAVDLIAGEFAFARYYDFFDDNSWEDYLKQSRFQDVRLAVCECHQFDREEMVFMSFLNEGRWKDLDSTSGWQFDLGSGKIMEEVKSIVNQAITIKDLGYESSEGYIPGERVIEDIIRQGEELALKLWKQEKQKKKSQDQDIFDQEVGRKFKRETGLDDAYDL